MLVEGTGESQSTSAALGSEGISMGGQEGAKDGDSVIDDDDGDIDEDEGYEQGGYLMEDRDMEAMR